MIRVQLGPSYEAKVIRLASELDIVREQSEGDEADRKATVNRSKAMEGKKRERSEAERLCGSLGEAEGKRCSIISKLQGLQRADNYFDRRMEDLGV